MLAVVALDPVVTPVEVPVVTVPVVDPVVPVVVDVVEPVVVELVVLEVVDPVVDAVPDEPPVTVDPVPKNPLLEPSPPQPIRIASTQVITKTKRRLLLRRGTPDDMCSSTVQARQKLVGAKPGGKRENKRKWGPSPVPIFGSLLSLLSRWSWRRRPSLLRQRRQRLSWWWHLRSLPEESRPSCRSSLSSTVQALSFLSSLSWTEDWMYRRCFRNR